MPGICGKQSIKTQLQLVAMVFPQQGGNTVQLSNRILLLQKGAALGGNLSWRVEGKVLACMTCAIMPSSGLCRYRHKRHTFAVRVLNEWVREGRNLTTALPNLAIYMEHEGLKASQHDLRLNWLERVRHCGVATRNQRLAALKSFFH